VLEGQVGFTLFEQLVNDPPQTNTYDADDVTDWLVFGSGDLAPAYESNGHDIALINSTLDQMLEIDRGFQFSSQIGVDE
jgi:hypothetical protein